MFPFHHFFSFNKQKEDNKWMEGDKNKKSVTNVIISQQHITSKHSYIP